MSSSADETSLSPPTDSFPCSPSATEQDLRARLVEAEDYIKVLLQDNDRLHQQATNSEQHASQLKSELEMTGQQLLQLLEAYESEKQSLAAVSTLRRENDILATRLASFKSQLINARCAMENDWKLVEADVALLAEELRASKALAKSVEKNSNIDSASSGGSGRGGGGNGSRSKTPPPLPPPTCTTCEGLQRALQQAQQDQRVMEQQLNSARSSLTVLEERSLSSTPNAKHHAAVVRDLDDTISKLNLQIIEKNGVIEDLQVSRKSTGEAMIAQSTHDAILQTMIAKTEQYRRQADDCVHYRMEAVAWRQRAEEALELVDDLTAQCNHAKMELLEVKGQQLMAVATRYSAQSSSQSMPQLGQSTITTSGTPPTPPLTMHHLSADDDDAITANLNEYQRYLSMVMTDALTEKANLEKEVTTLAHLQQQLEARNHEIQLLHEELQRSKQQLYSYGSEIGALKAKIVQLEAESMDTGNIHRLSLDDRHRQQLGDLALAQQQWDAERSIAASLSSSHRQKIEGELRDAKLKLSEAEASLLALRETLTTYLHQANTGGGQHAKEELEDLRHQLSAARSMAATLDLQNADLVKALHASTLKHEELWVQHEAACRQHDMAMKELRHQWAQVKGEREEAMAEVAALRSVMKDEIQGLQTQLMHYRQLCNSSLHRHTQSLVTLDNQGGRDGAEGGGGGGEVLDESVSTVRGKFRSDLQQQLSLAAGSVTPSGGAGACTRTGVGAVGRESGGQDAALTSAQRQLDDARHQILVLESQLKERERTQDVAGDGDGRLHLSSLTSSTTLQSVVLAAAATETELSQVKNSNKLLLEEKEILLSLLQSYKGDSAKLQSALQGQVSHSAALQSELDKVSAKNSIMAQELAIYENKLIYDWENSIRPRGPVRVSPTLSNHHSSSIIHHPSSSINPQTSNTPHLPLSQSQDGRPYSHCEAGGGGEWGGGGERNGWGERSIGGETGGGVDRAGHGGERARVGERSALADDYDIIRAKRSQMLLLENNNLKQRAALFEKLNNDSHEATTKLTDRLTERLLSGPGGASGAGGETMVDRGDWRSYDRLMLQGRASSHRTV